MLFKISTRSLMLGAVLFGFSLTPVFADSVTNDGPTITDGTGPSDISTGDNGYTGHAGEDGGSGGNGGNITSVVPGSSSSNNNGVGAISTGGDGGEGGEAVEGDSEMGRDPEPAGKGGNGGNGGDIDLTLTGHSDGSVSAQSFGGKAGEPGQGGMATAVGGTGGDVKITIDANASVTGNVMAGSVGGDSNGHLAYGKSGDVTVTISGTVNGAVYATSLGDDADVAGKVKVVIDGGVVTGIITANTKDTSELTFKFDVADRAEYKAAVAVLTDQETQSHGTVTINSKTYEWTGFSALVNLLSYVGPEDKVVVSVKETTNENPTTTVGDPVAAPKTVAKQEEEPAKPKIVAGIEVIQGKPEMAKCSGGSEIRTVRLDDGSVVVIHHNRGADTLIGQLEGGEFHRASDAPDWTVQVGDSGKTVSVSDATGNALSNCSFS